MLDPPSQHGGVFGLVVFDQTEWAKLAHEAPGFLYATGTRGRKVQNVQIRIEAPRPIVAVRFLRNGSTAEGANVIDDIHRHLAG